MFIKTAEGALSSGRPPCPAPSRGRAGRPWRSRRAPATWPRSARACASATRRRRWAGRPTP
eukprot:6205648-Prymnesium_polylepis.1